MNMHHITTDVLIMGGGSAGLWAAYRCSELAPEARICIVDKGPRDWGGLMTMAGGDFEAVLPPDNVDEWVRDFIYYFDGLCDQDLMEEILKRSADRLHDYERFGCEFFKKEDGSMKYVPQRGLDHVKLYPAQLKGRGGELMVKNIVRQLKQRSVERVGRILDRAAAAGRPRLRRPGLRYHQRRFLPLRRPGGHCRQRHGRLEDLVRQEHAYRRDHADDL